MTRLLSLLVLTAALALISAENGSLNFLLFGDWGGQSDSPYYTRAEVSVASVMAEKAQELGSQFIVALGDNFYSYGVKDVDDPRFKETFEASLVARGGVSATP